MRSREARGLDRRFMDNLSHTLAGLLLGKAVLAYRPRALPEATRRARVVLVTASALAQNLPDFDFLYAGITPGKLGYLLHHRGHTHTLPVALVLAGLLYAGARALLARGSPTAFDRRALLGLTLLGPVLHIAMDFSNNYGVHPFWPFDNRWFYGDAVFIVEPWLWVAAFPALIASTRGVVRALLGLLFALCIGLAFIVPVVPLGLSLALAFTAIALTALAFRLKDPQRFTVALAAWASVTALFAVTSARARANAMAAMRPEEGAVLDVVTTPFPGHPFCFNATLLGTRAEQYWLRTAQVSAAPGLFPATSCPTGFDTELGTSTARLEPARSPSTRAVRLVGSWEGRTAELARLAREDCRVHALMRFVRIPFYRLEGDRWVVGDLRYDRDARLDFAELSFDAGSAGQCPPAVPPWRPPREDLLGHGGPARSSDVTGSEAPH
ncbi:MAG TPA: metal-dependent hydrolase [Polyangiaceae bacterium]|nr:metal-dependent hydrolase [Polyangiaceae bacterium]